MGWSIQLGKRVSNGLETPARWIRRRIDEPPALRLQSPTDSETDAENSRTSCCPFAGWTLSERRPAPLVTVTEPFEESLATKAFQPRYSGNEGMKRLYGRWIDNWEKKLAF